MKIGIVGFGVVGQAIGDQFNRTMAVFDRLEPFSSKDCKSDIQGCDIVFVCVGTPGLPDGSCDVSAVEEVCSWIKPPICIKSTVPVGTTDRLIADTGKKICRSPEYIGETAWHDSSWAPVIVGGDPEACKLTIRAYQEVLGPEPRYIQTTAKAAELAKYMVNCFLATKVSFVNQFYDIAESCGIDFNELRELWLADPRMGRSHSMVTEERGYGGRCLPKDMSAMIEFCRAMGDSATLLEAVSEFNQAVRSDAKRTAGVTSR